MDIKTTPSMEQTRKRVHSFKREIHSVRNRMKMFLDNYTSDISRLRSPKPKTPNSKLLHPIEDIASFVSVTPIHNAMSTPRISKASLHYINSTTKTRCHSSHPRASSTLLEEDFSMDQRSNGSIEFWSINTESDASESDCGESQQEKYRVCNETSTIHNTNNIVVPVHANGIVLQAPGTAPAKLSDAGKRPLYKSRRENSLRRQNVASVSLRSHTCKKTVIKKLKRYGSQVRNGDISEDLTTLAIL